MSSDANPTGTTVGPDSKGYSLTSTQARVLRSHAAAALELPPPGETWTLVDVGSKARRARRRFAAHDLIQIVEKAENGCDRRNVYRTTPHVYDYIQEQIEPPSTLPCGHRGVRNVPDGGYTCFDEGCDREFSREIAEEVYAE